ncbi:MAG: sigma 54-interacting transcriptional regulator [Myxococcaceae bacterium]|nr:sigma 54-interacting transcriptional regulator [Myxococcaceae bacterium]
MPALLLLTGPSAGLRFDVVTEAILGRSPSCEIPLEDHKVSRRHAKIVVEQGQAKITDLGSRNGTVVNGERIEGEAILLPGDRVQVGDTTILFEPPTRAAFAEKDAGNLTGALVEELLPRVGSDAAVFSAAAAMIGATSEAMVLRRAAEEVVRSMNADRAAALLGGTEGLLTAAVVGAASVEVPRSLVRAALERREAASAGGSAVAPLAASGGAPFGLLYVERTEPFDVGDRRVLAMIGRLAGETYTRVRASGERERPEVALVGSSRQFRKTVEQARRAAASGEPVAIFGEPGTGKMLTAQYIHSRSSRALGPFIQVDCRAGAIAVEEALLGRASAPGVPPLPSALLRADGGTLVLQGIESLPRQAAERLARLLHKRVAPAPGGGEEKVDLRVIATAGHPVELLASRGEVDPVLARALSGTQIELIPLRDRRTDVPALFEYFAQRAPRVPRREVPQLSPDARRLLVDYGWPGNVRELRLVSERLALLYSGSEVTALKLPPEVQEGVIQQSARNLQRMIQRLERDAISEALREACGKKIKAAAILGISRPTLDKKIGDYGLVVEKRRA